MMIKAIVTRESHQTRDSDWADISWGQYISLQKLIRCFWPHCGYFAWLQTSRGDSGCNRFPQVLETNCINQNVKQKAQIIALTTLELLNGDYDYAFDGACRW